MQLMEKLNICTLSFDTVNIIAKLAKVEQGYDQNSLLVGSCSKRVCREYS